MDKILFICKSNTGRSQMAAAFLKKRKPELIVLDAGSQVGDRSGTIIHEYVIEVMKELDIDLSNNIRKQLTPDMVNKADKIIIMDKKENLPDYLINSGKMIFWDVEDAAGTDLEFHRKIRDQINTLVDSNF
ncbi:MAG: low molecular weight phosphatase family protein [Patescibacteria group bacterium]